jgi:hypothetical protein
METIRESNRIGAGAEGRKRDILKIGIIVGSTRPGRKAVAVAKWVHDILKSRKDADFEIAARNQGACFRSPRCSFEASNSVSTLESRIKALNICKAQFKFR